MEPGSPFPPFSLADQDGKTLTNQDLVGSKAIVYFYPKDDTSGCTKEACEFRDSLPKFEGAKVIGVSPDSSKSHRKFVDKYELTLWVFGAWANALADGWGAWVKKRRFGNTDMGVERSTFLLDEKGNIVKVWRKVKPEGHAAEVLAALA